VSRSSSTRECGLFEEAGGHGIQMDVLVEDIAGHFRSPDCPAQLGAWRGNPRAKTGLEPLVRRTGFGGGAKLAVVNIGGQRRTSPQRVERPGGVPRDRQRPVDVAQWSDSGGVRGGRVDDAQHVGEKRGRCRVKGFNPASKSRSSWPRISAIRSAATPRVRLARGNRLGLSGSAGQTSCRPGRFETSTRYRQPPQVEGSAPFRIFAMRADRARPSR
jgi:hypothetical protein